MSWFSFEICRILICEICNDIDLGAGIYHPAKPIPQSNTSLLSVLDHVKNILPDYKFNSILITKYCDGFDNLWFHSDNEEQIGILSDIFTVR